MKPDEINALPEPARRYIMLLETESDPADTIRENVRLRNENEFLRSECAVLARDWRPIETAPKDGTTILICGGTCMYDASTSETWDAHPSATTANWDNYREMFWSGYGSEYDGKFWHRPTHWMPMPQPAKVS